MLRAESSMPEAAVGHGLIVDDNEAFMAMQEAVQEQEVGQQQVLTYNGVACDKAA
jgi:hypothetical protein